jgi:hypothetical protein
VPSVLGLLEAKESAAREEAARIAAVLDEAERALERLVIAREAVVETLADPIAKTPAPVGKGAGGAVVGAAVAGSPVPRRDEQSASVALAPEYQRIISVLETGAAQGRGGMRAKDLAAALGLELVPAKIESVRSRARRLAGRGLITRHRYGEFSALTAWRRGSGRHGHDLRGRVGAAGEATAHEQGTGWGMRLDIASLRVGAGVGEWWGRGAGRLLLPA